MRTKADVRHNRKRIMQESEKRTLYKKGNLRTPLGRVCNICQRPLAGRNIFTGKVETQFDYYKFKLGDFLTVNLCANIDNCYSQLKKAGELVE